jgi:hypothetical protein
MLRHRQAGVLKLIEITKVLQEMHHGQQHQEDTRSRVVVSSQPHPQHKLHPYILQLRHNWSFCVGANYLIWKLRYRFGP